MEGYMAQIKLFAADFAPKNWAFCQGQTIQIAQNSALFSLLGTTYGGNGMQTFGLPNFAGRVAIGTDASNNHNLGEMGGSNNTTLTPSNMPAHTHTVTASVKTVASSTGGSDEPSGAYWAAGANNFPTAKSGTMNSGTVSTSVMVAPAGEGKPFNNAQPYLGMNHIICMYGMYPSRS